MRDAVARVFSLLLVVGTLISVTADAADPAQVSSASATVGGAFIDLEGRALDFPLSLTNRAGDESLTADASLVLRHDMSGQLTSTSGSLTNLESLELGALDGMILCSVRSGQLRGKNNGTGLRLRMTLVLHCVGSLTSPTAGDVDVDSLLKIRSDLDETSGESGHRMTLRGRLSVGGEEHPLNLRSTATGTNLPQPLSNLTFGPSGTRLAVLMPDLRSTPKPGRFESPNASVLIEKNAYAAPAEGSYKEKKDRSGVQLRTSVPGGRIVLKNYAVDGSGNLLAGSAAYSIKGYRGKGELSPGL